MGIQHKLSAFYNKQATSPSTSQLVPSRRRRSALPKESSLAATAYSTSPSSSDSGDLRDARAGRIAVGKVDGQPRRRRSHDDKYPRIGYFHPQSNFIRARFPTPRGPQPKVEAFTTTAGQAAQLSARVPLRRLSGAALSKSAKENVPDSQAGLHGTIKSVLTFGSRKRRRYGHAGEEAKGRRFPMLPPMRFLSGGSLHILDNIGGEEKTKDNEPEIEPVSVVTQPPEDKQSDEMDTTPEDDFDTEEAIARFNIIAAAPVIRPNAVQKHDDVPSLWRRLSQKGRISPSDQLNPNYDPPVKFNLPSPTMLNTYDLTSGFVNIPVASADGSAASRNVNTILLSTVSNNDISDDDFLVESPKSRNSKLERGGPGYSPSRKLSHMSNIIHCASMTIRAKARQHRAGNSSVIQGMRNGNGDTGPGTNKIGDITGTTSSETSEPIVSCEVSKLSGRSGSLKGPNRNVYSEDGSFLRKLRSRVLAFVTPRSQRPLIRKAKPDEPVAVQIEPLYSTIDNKSGDNACIDEHKPKYDDKLKKGDPASASASQVRVTDAPVIDTSNLSPSDWEQMTPGTQTTFVASPTADLPKLTGTVRFNKLVEIMGEEDSFVIVEPPIVHTPTGDDLSVEEVAQQQACLPMANAPDPIHSPIATVSDSGSTLVSPRPL
ncbi:hypothetical protein V1525DRAFT_393132 [Lipomyces kononenkoae]|uniref:Uncharacterized protein n=1 Tax=Lipomyces kononenkoae TaxID=34357 RepID=A0ACC3TEW0_LIPKO